MRPLSTSARRRLIHSHPRLMGSLLIGVVAGACFPQTWGLTFKCLVGWNVAVWIYLTLCAWLVMRDDEHQIRRLAQHEDANAIFATAIMSFGAMVSLAAIIVELSSAKNVSGDLRVLHYALTASTVLGSWLLVALIYSFHYVHLYYRCGDGPKPLRFPEDQPKPGYWDFLYFSITIAVAAQTSDVSVMSTPARKVVMAQSALSFLFNAAIIGMSINIAASVVGG